MAPEVFKHEEYDAKVDIYSYALVVYWILAGERPFADIYNPVEAARLASTGERTPYEKHVKPASLRPLLKRSWSLDPAERPDFTEIVVTVKNFSERSSNKGCSIQ